MARSPQDPANTAENGDAPEAASDRRPLLVLLGAFVPLVVYVLFTRLWRLDLKPVQHDESMFAYYGYLITTGNNYVYQPILHGPVLQWMEALCYTLFGDSNYTMRLYPALSGIAVLGLVLAMGRRLGGRATFLAVLFLAISPTLTFFTRFCRNDLPFLAMAMGMVYVGWLYSRKQTWVRLLTIFVLGALAISIKETYAIFFFLLATFCLGCWIHGKVKKTPPREIPFYGQVRHAVLHQWYLLPVGLGLAAAIIVTLFTSFFSYMEHWDGVWEAILYWQGEHSKDRIKGAFHFYLIRLAMYELPFLIFWVVCQLQGMWPATPGPRRVLYRIAFFVWLALSAVFLLYPTADGVPLWYKRLPNRVYDLTHMGLGLHIWIFAQVCLVVGIAGWKNLGRGRVLLAFTDYWAAGSFLAYSYAGEKVPWVGTHMVLPMLISCGLYLNMAIERLVELRAALKRAPEAKKPVASKRKRKRKPRVPAETSLGRAGSVSFRGLRYAGLTLFAAGLLWELWLTTQLCFRDPGNSMELHTYASSHTEFHNTMNAILRQAHEQYDGYDTEIAFWGTQSWPLMWTLRKYKRARNVPVGAGTRARYIILDNTIYEGAGEPPDDHPPPYLDRYDWVKTRFRWYWQPMPLRWHAMRKFWLLWSDESKMTDDTRSLAKAAREDWAKLFKATIYRDEYLDRADPHRWDHLGGFNVYFGRLKDDPAAETGSNDQGGP